MNHKLKVLAIALMGVLALALLAGCQPSPPSDAVEISLGQAIALSQSNNISEVNVETDRGWMVMKARVEGAPPQVQAGGQSTAPAFGRGDSGPKTTEVTDGLLMFAYIDAMNAADLQQLGFMFPQDLYVNQGTSNSSGGSSYLALLPLLFLALLLFMLFRGARSARSQMGQMSDFARSKARAKAGDTPTTTFADVAGVPEAKQDLQEVVEFLKHGQKFRHMGARIPKGVLLVGPPGTGKTLLARAVAGEAGVPFFSMSGSEFVEMFVGVGASRVRDLFQKAKTARPSIIFIDEIDAVGRKRSVGPGASHEEREQTLNQILSEMDGFNPNSGIIVLAATNRPDVLDPALLRPGRFDRRVMLDAPDFAGRKAILQIHMQGKPLDESVNVDALAKETHGFSGADLANLINEAAILAAVRDKEAITMAEFNESLDRVIAGPARRSREVNLRDKERTAYHEGGHALVAHLLPQADPVFKVSIVARGSMGGYTRTIPEEEHYLMTKPQLQDTLATLLAGHVAEKTIYGNVSTGPHDDIKRATLLARKMITDYGMSETLSPRTFGGDETAWGVEQRDYGEDVAREIDREVHTLISEAYERARKLIEDNRARLVYLARKLIEAETLEGQELRDALGGPRLEEAPKNSEQGGHTPEPGVKVDGPGQAFPVPGT